MTNPVPPTGRQRPDPAAATPAPSTGSLPGVDVVPLHEVDDEEVVAALQAAFDSCIDVDWYRWKHHDNPAGPSVGLAARDAKGLLGVRPFMRWELTAGAETIRAVRPVDAATVPRARRRGVFRLLTHAVLDELASSRDVRLIFNTPNANSIPGYATSGWTLLPPVHHVLVPRLRARGARLEEDSEALDAIVSAAARHDGLRSRRSRRWLEWRYEHRSGHSYRSVRLREAEGPNGLVYRVDERRDLRILIVCELEGDVRTRRRLVSSAASAECARVVLAVGGPGASSQVTSMAIRRGSSVLAVRPLAPMLPDPTSRGSWSVTLGDLERVL